MMKLLRLLLAIASGLLLFLAFPPFNQALLVWVWIFPLLFALWSAEVSRKAVKTWKSKLEWLRGTLFSGFGWNGLGVPLISELALVQSADVVGVTGLSFLPVFCSCILYNTVLRFQEEVRASRVRPHLDFFVAVVLLLVDFL